MAERFAERPREEIGRRRRDAGRGVGRMPECYADDVDRTVGDFKTDIASTVPLVFARPAGTTVHLAIDAGDLDRAAGRVGH